MDLLRHIGKFHVTSEPWQAGFLWLFWGLVGGLLPLWGSALLFMLFAKHVEFYEFLKNGEFILYAASFLGGAMYSLRRDIFPSRNVLILGFGAVLCISALVFAAIALKGMQNSPEWLSIDRVSLTTVSIVVFVFSTLGTFLVVVAEAGGAGHDVPTWLKQNGQNLEETFTRLSAEKQAGPQGGAHG